MKLLLTILCLLGMTAGVLAQDVYTDGPYGFRMATNVTATSWTWTNDNQYPFRLYNLTFNTAGTVTTTVSLIRPHNLGNQVVGDVITTNDMGGVETNYYYTITNTVASYVTNQLLSVTNTSSVYDDTDFKKIYVLFGDIIKFDFIQTNSVSILIDAIR